MPDVKIIHFYTLPLHFATVFHSWLVDTFMSYPASMGCGWRLVWLADWLLQLLFASGSTTFSNYETIIYVFCIFLIYFFHLADTCESNFFWASFFLSLDFDMNLMNDIYRHRERWQWWCWRRCSEFYNFTLPNGLLSFKSWGFIHSNIHSLLMQFQNHDWQHIFVV